MSRTHDVTISAFGLDRLEAELEAERSLADRLTNALLNKLECELAEARELYETACETAAKMHAAAVGEIKGPHIDPVQDIAVLRREREEARVIASKYEDRYFEARAQCSNLDDQVSSAMMVIRGLERERDEWKAKYIQQNKDLGCEMMDPAGTIWDYASGLQRENVQLKRELNDAREISTKYEDRYFKTKEQRDRLAESLLSTLSSWITSPNADQATKALAEWKEARSERR